MPSRKDAKPSTSPLVRELRRKFIVWAMLASALVIVGIIAFVDISYWAQTQAKIDRQLDMLASYDGSLENWLGAEGRDRWMMQDGEEPPEPPEGFDADDFEFDDANAEADGSSRPEPPARPENGLAGGPRNGGRGFGRSSSGVNPLSDLGGLVDSYGLTAESPFQMRFFSVAYDEQAGVFGEVDITRIASVTEADALDLAATARDAGKQRAYLGTMRYLVTEVDETSTLYLFVDCTSEVVSLRSLVIASVSIVVIALLLVFVLVFLFSKQAVAPVAESYARQRRFITDASHDLKTPLAVIGSDVDVIELTEGASEWTDSIRHQVERMTDLTNKLVMLSRMDEGTEQVHKADFDLEALAESVALEFKPVAETNGKRIVCEAEARLTAHGDATLIDQALHLLIDNALKYSSEAATIHVRASSRRGGWLVAVENPVDEIEAGSHDELFERFTRADSSRSSSTGGHGIGLAVVKAIAEAHGGKATATSKDPHTIEFRVEF